MEKIAEAGELFVSIFRSEGRAFDCGNGGSICDAMHFAKELTGTYRNI